MVNRTNNNIARSREHIHDTFPPDRERVIRRRPAGTDEDLIASLANAKENRRARQVIEWETIRRLSFPASV